MKIKKIELKKASVLVMFIVGILFGFICYDILVNEPVPMKKWHVLFKGTLLEALAEASPGAGASGFLEVFFINHSVGNDYIDVNTSATLEGWCTANNLGYATADDTEVDLAHSTNFDIAIKVRGNATHCKDGATWMDTHLNVTITWSDETMTDAQPDHQTTSGHADFNNTAWDYLYVIFAWDNSNSGFTISKGETGSEIESIEFAAYY